MSKLSRLFALIAFVAVSASLSAPVSVASDSNQLKGWEFSSEDDGVKVWSRDIPGTSIVAFRGETVIDAPISRVTGVLDDAPRRLEWVHSAKVSRSLRSISQLERVEYNRTGAPWPLLDRDFVFKAKIALDRKKRQVHIDIKSTEDSLMPEADCCVRGEITNSTYILTSTPDGKKTHVVVEINADPKGGIPKWIVNLFQKSWPRKTLQGIARQVAKPDVKELALVRAYFDGQPIDGFVAADTLTSEDLIRDSLKATASSALRNSPK